MTKSVLPKSCACAQLMLNWRIVNGLPVAICVDRMSECGEDLLVDLSEILFNELAFFRLMQDLDESKAKVRAKLKSFEKVFIINAGWLSCIQFCSLC